LKSTLALIYLKQYNSTFHLKIYIHAKVTKCFKALEGCNIYCMKQYQSTNWLVGGLNGLKKKCSNTWSTNVKPFKFKHSTWILHNLNISKHGNLNQTMEIKHGISTSI
jgi:hypothetical protein